MLACVIGRVFFFMHTFYFNNCGHTRRKGIPEELMVKDWKDRNQKRSEAQERELEAMFFLKPTLIHKVCFILHFTGSMRRQRENDAPANYWCQCWGKIKFKNLNMPKDIAALPQNGWKSRIYTDEGIHLETYRHEYLTVESHIIAIRTLGEIMNFARPYFEIPLEQ